MSELAKDRLVVRATPEAIRAVIDDPDALARVLPGAESLVPDGPGRWRGVLATRVGFMTVRADAVATLLTARELGIDFLDTARYHDAAGFSEVVFGELFWASGWRRDEVTIANKLWWEFWPDQSVEEEIDASLRRTRLDHFDLIYSDPPPNELAMYEVVNAVTNLLWAGKAHHPEAHARNAVFYGEKAIDRSPCGTGTSSRMAQLAARGELKVGDDFVHESIIGSLFRGRVEAAAKAGDLDAIVPSVAGQAWITGHNTIFLDDRDPFVKGFSVL